MSKNNKRYGTAKAQPVKTAVQPKKEKRRLRLPGLYVLPIMFALVWVWASYYYGDVLRMMRERSFWVPDTEEMSFLISQRYGWLRYVGRIFIMLFRYPWLGGCALAAVLTLGTWAFGYILRLRGYWRAIQYLPLGVLLMYLSYEGLNLFFDTETGIIMFLPVALSVILAVIAGIIALTTKWKSPADTPLQNWIQALVLLVMIAGPVAYTEIERPYVRVIAGENVCVINKDWLGTMKIARDHAGLSYRPIAAFYAIALVETDQICDRMYDIRMDYDSLYLHGPNGEHSMELNLYQEDCDYYAGLVEPCIHHAIERNTMIGPNIHSLELLTKCAILHKEWEVANKYLRVLQDVPFEGGFVDKYTTYIQDSTTIANDPEMALIIHLEPVHDSFENVYQQPTFMGYNLSLTEGRSDYALKNSLAVCMYTKLMPAFIIRTGPLRGNTPPENVADALCLMSAKDPSILNDFTGLDYHMSRLRSSLAAMQPYLQDRPGNARMLFDVYKGYYPYYYFFGNLKATRKRTENASSNAGVN